MKPTWRTGIATEEVAGETLITGAPDYARGQKKRRIRALNLTHRRIGGSRDSGGSLSWTCLLQFTRRFVTRL